VSTAAFSKVDELLLAATAAAPAVALLAARAAERGITEAKLANHLRTNPTVLRWVLNWRLMPLQAAALTWKPKTMTLPSWCSGGHGSELGAAA
jgi:hypothetical protein